MGRGLDLDIPFLQVLFGQVSPPEQAPEWAWNVRQIVEVLNYRFGSYITEHGETSGLIMVCVVVISIFFLVFYLQIITGSEMVRSTLLDF